MKNVCYSLLILSLLTLLSCARPNFKFRVKPPPGWTMSETVMQNLKVRLLLAPDSLAKEGARVNIIVVSMNGRHIDDFTVRNMDYLKTSSDSVVLMERGSIHISSNTVPWFTYTKIQNGIKRELINYIIPYKGFAYMITCGTNEGYINKYRPIFDEVAKSFRI